MSITFSDWVETYRKFDDFPLYASNYERDIRVIMDSYLDFLDNYIVLPIAHINELIIYLFTGKQRGSTACGVELSKNYDIIGGRIHACADLPLEYVIGDIGDDGSLHISKCDLSALIEYRSILGCNECEIFAYCGGRCPVQALTSSAERFFQHCQLIQLHIRIIQEYVYQP